MKPSPILRHLLALGLFLALAGCASLEPSVPSGAVLFQDDFSRPDSGWDRYRDAIYQADYVEGRYEIAVFQPNTDAWATPRLHFENVYLDVEATKLEGPDDNIFGFICRYQDPQNYYFLLISSDGFAGVGLAKSGRRKLLSDDAMLPSAAILQGQASNHLRAECEGYDLRLFVNGVPVAEARAAEWPSGDVGLLAGTYDEAGTRIAFDNFSVVKP